MDDAKPIYLDYNATTPIDPNVFKAMTPYFTEYWGNPSSTHLYGRQVTEALATARKQVADLIRAKPQELVFTSGGTESNNQALIGTALAQIDRGKHIITTQIEHPSIREPLEYLKAKFGFTITYLPTDAYGMVQPSQIARAITDETALITIMHANNEVGTIQPIDQIGRIAQEHNITFHTDAAQSCGKIEVNVDQLHVELLTLAGHKLYAPKGIGALYIRTGTHLDPLIHGAGQENDQRPGTENVPYIVGLGQACRIARQNLQQFKQKMETLRSTIHHNLQTGIGRDRVKLNGHPQQRLPNTLNVSIDGTIGETLLHQIPEIAASTGSACHAGSTEPSSVLLALGLSLPQALAALRLSLGRWTSETDVHRASQLITQKVKELT